MSGYTGYNGQNLPSFGPKAWPRVGTVAAVNWPRIGEVAAVKVSPSCWAKIVYEPTMMIEIIDQGHLSDIRPGVTIEATREDAALLDLLGPTSGPGRQLLNRIRDAIREQLPEPEPPKPRWRAAHLTVNGKPKWAVFDGDRPSSIDGTREQIEKYADALNTAESKP